MNQDCQSHILLLTATIAPRPPFDSIPRSNAAIRHADYCKSLKKWLAAKNDRISGIVFCDNSGHSLDALRELVDQTIFSKPVEFLSFESAPVPEDVHYGYSELELVSHALDHSRLLQTNDFFIKATGRLYFPRLAVLMGSLPRHYCSIVDCRGIHRHEIGLPIRARTQLMFFQKSFYRHHIDRHLKAMPLRNDSHIEEFIAYCLLKACCDLDSTSILFRFPRACDPLGISGNGVHYASPARKLRNMAASLLRDVMPSLYA
ncbi:MAG: hypothetical protein ACKO5F_07720 [Synechococcus sp.]